MVESEYSTNNYMYLKFSIGTTKRNPDMLRVVPYHFKTKKMDKHAVEKLAFEIRYVPD